MSDVGRITGADFDDNELRKACVAGTAAYRAALKAAGYLVEKVEIAHRRRSAVSSSVDAGQAERACAQCGQAFEPDRFNRQQRYCSARCRYAHRDGTLPPAVERASCAECGTLFEYERTTRSRRFCSKACSGPLQLSSPASADDKARSLRSLQQAVHLHAQTPLLHGALSGAAP